jgi:hypothetical protein
MGVITKPNTYVAGSTILASEVNANEDTLYTLVNGNIENANIKAAAAIAYSKLNLTGAILAADLATDAVETAKIKDANVTTAKIADDAVDGDKLADDTVDDSKLNLTQDQTRKGNNAAITATASLGTTIITHASLPAGKYIFYGNCACYVDTGADVTGAIIWELNDGSSQIHADMPGFKFDSASGAQTEWSGAGFITVNTLSGTTTVNLAAYKKGGITNGNYSGATMFGYIRIA